MKLVRQAYFIAKQKEFLKFVVQQWAREQLVILSLRLELRQLDALLSIFKKIDCNFSEENFQQTSRMVFYITAIVFLICEVFMYY